MDLTLLTTDSFSWKDSKTYCQSQAHLAFSMVKAHWTYFNVPGTSPA